MNLIEEKAKKILDFLAQKAGYDCIEIHYANNIGCWIPRCCIRFNNIEDIVGNIWESDCFQRFNICKKSYAMLLKKMFETSSRGVDVYGGSKMLLPSRSILEAILVEMDLSCHDR